MNTKISIPYIELCAGVSAFSSAAKKISNVDFESIGACEVDSFCNTYLDQEGLNIYGDLNYLCVSEDEHPYSKLCEEDIVPCEYNNGISSLTMNDLMEGVVAWPKMMIAGWPCQSLSSANTKENEGIRSGKSQLIETIQEKVELLNSEVLIYENSDNLRQGGLVEMVKDLSDKGYSVEWAVISASSFGYPFIRNRMFVIAYNEDSPLYHSQTKVLDVVTQQYANKLPGTTFPFLNDHSDELVSEIVTLETKGNYRRHRVAALGNSIVVDIAQAILQVIADLYVNPVAYSDLESLNTSPFSYEELKTHEKTLFKVMPYQGCLDHKTKQLFYSERNYQLNPSTTTHRGKGMMASLIRNDHKNNFTTSSRLTRPGSLGGLVGYLMKELSLDEGAINPIYCEKYMGFEPGQTQVTQKLIRDKVYKKAS